MKEILADAAELAPVDREAYLLQACNGDTRLLKEARFLLSFEQDPGLGELAGDRLPSGTLLGARYLVQGRLAEGGFSTTYVAFDQKLMNRRVVIKLLARSQQEPYLRRKFREELQALSALEHPRIIAPLDNGELADGTPFLVTQFAEGQTLRALFGKGLLPLERLAGILEQVGQTLGFVHAHGIYHRDLKPENIIVQTFSDGSDHVRLIDFGIATITENGGDRATRVIGSLAYMSPEQLKGVVSASSDVYALGVLAYEGVTGALPFVADSPVELAELQRQEVRVRPTRLRPQLPPAAESLILSALRFHPAQRPSDAVQLGSQMGGALRLRHVAGESTKAIRAFAILVILLSGIGAAWHVSQSLSKRKAAQQGTEARSGSRSSRAAVEPQLGIQLTRRSREPLPPDAGGVVHLSSSEQFRFLVHPGAPGYLYLFAESSSSPDLHILYPSATSYDGSSRVSPPETFQIPEQSWLQLSATRGSETLYFAVSPYPEAQMEAAARWANQRDRGLMRDAGVSAEIRQMLRSRAASSSWKGAQIVIAQTDHLAIGSLEIRHP